MRLISIMLFWVGSTASAAAATEAIDYSFTCQLENHFIEISGNVNQDRAFPISFVEVFKGRQDSGGAAERVYAGAFRLTYLRDDTPGSFVGEVEVWAYEGYQHDHGVIGIMRLPDDSVAYSDLFIEWGDGEDEVVSGDTIECQVNPY